jgi:hypothetical protein
LKAVADESVYAVETAAVVLASVDNVGVAAVTFAIVCMLGSRDENKEVNGDHRKETVEPDNDEEAAFVIDLESKGLAELEIGSTSIIWIVGSLTRAGRYLYAGLRYVTDVSDQIDSYVVTSDPLRPRMDDLTWMGVLRIGNYLFVTSVYPKTREIRIVSL